MSEPMCRCTRCLEAALAAKEQENAELRTQMAALLRVDDPHTVLTSLEVLLKDADARAIAAEARAEGLAAALASGCEGCAANQPRFVMVRHGYSVAWHTETDEDGIMTYGCALNDIHVAALDAYRTQAPGV